MVRCNHLAEVLVMDIQKYHRAPQTQQAAIATSPKPQVQHLCIIKVSHFIKYIKYFCAPTDLM